jgi:mannose/fructose/N-acetylgalactosamine-specific phosphotransferase system component IIC
MIFLEAILSGIWATIFMDSLAKILARRGIIYPFVTQEAMGRWFLYMWKGKFTHDDIKRTRALKNEQAWYYLSHYLIGILLAGFYLILSSYVQVLQEQLWLIIVYGLLTVAFSWFWLLPGIGFGMLAKKSAKRSRILPTNLINHLNFGIGLYIWMLVFHRLFVQF